MKIPYDVLARPYFKMCPTCGRHGSIVDPEQEWTSPEAYSRQDALELLTSCSWNDLVMPGEIPYLRDEIFESNLPEVAPLAVMALAVETCQDMNAILGGMHQVFRKYDEERFLKKVRGTPVYKH
ncbi:MAG: hypothetical protein AAB523_03315 [Patescibacteria group bacterium]